MSWKDAPLSNTGSWRDTPLASKTPTDVLTKQNDTPVDSEPFERAKTLSYLQQKGYGIGEATLDSFAEHVFGQSSSYGAINKKLHNQTAIEPLGPVRSNATTRKHDVKQLIHEQETASLVAVPYEVSSGERQRTIDEASFGMEAFAGMPMKGFAESWVHLGGSPATILSSFGGWNMFLGDLVGSQKLTNYGRGLVRSADRFYDSKKAQKALDDVFDLSNIAEDSFVGQVVRVVGQAVGYGKMGPAAPYAIYSGIYSGMREQMEPSLGKERSAQYAALMAPSMWMISNKALGDVFKKAAPNTYKGAKSILNNWVRRVGNKSLPAGFEAVSEVGEEVYPDYVTGGIEKVVKNLPKYADVGLVSFIGTLVTGVGVDIQADASRAEATALYKAALVTEGFDSSSAERIAKVAVSGASESKVDEAISEEARRAENAKALQNAADQLSNTIDEAAEGTNTQIDITGRDGTPLTEDDIAVLRENPEQLEDLDDSEEADLLRAWVLEGDEAAGAEYNRRIVGVAEEVETEESPEEAPPEIPEQHIDPVVEEETDEDGVPSVIGVSRDQSNKLNTIMGWERQSAPERKANVALLQRAKDQNLDQQAWMLVNDILSRVDSGNRPSPISDDQVAGMLLAKADNANEIDRLQQALLDAADANDDALFKKLSEELSSVAEQGIRLTKAMSLVGTEAARSLQAMAMAVDRQSFSLVNILGEATRVNKKPLTPEQKTKFTQLANELKGWQDIAQQYADEADALALQLSEEVARGVVETEIGKARKSTKKIQSAKNRLEAKRALEKLGVGVAYDLGGVTAEASKLIAKIAISHIQDGASTIEEVVSRVQQDIPDASPKNIYDALGGRVRNSAKKIKTEAEARITELKKQARLYGEIEDLVGQFKLIDTDKNINQITADLKNALKLLGASVVQTERDSARADKVLERIVEIEDMVTNHHRVIKVKRLESADLKAARSMLGVANKELRAQDRITILKEILDVGVQKSRASEDQSETSQRLEQFRAEIMLLEAQIKAKETTEKQQARLAEIVGEVEGFVRTIHEQKPKPPKNATQEEIAKYKQARRDQDRIAELLETLRTGVVNQPKPVGKKSDPFGYKETIQNLRNEIKDQEWWQDVQQIKREADALIKVTKSIAQMEQDLIDGNLEPYMTTSQKRVVKNDKLAEARLKEHQLKREIKERIRALAPLTVSDIAWEVWDIPRTLKLTADIGHIWRQGGYFMSNPFKVNAVKYTWQSLKNFSERQADMVDLAIENSPYYVDMIADGVHIASETDTIAQREYALSNNILNAKRGLLTPVSKVVDASGRTQITSLNLLRAQIYEGFRRRYPDATKEERQDFAWYINIMTGRGDGLKARQFASITSRVLTSGRFTYSRFQAPTMLFRSRVWKNKALRQNVIEDTLSYWALRGALFGLAKLMWPEEVSFGTNPDHWTRGRIIVDLDGEYSRVYDYHAGMNKLASVMAEMAKLKGNNPLSIVLHELSKSVHPAATGIWQVATGKDYGGNDISRLNALGQMFTPIVLDNIIETFQKDTGILDMFFSTALDASGINSFLVPDEDLEGKTNWGDKATMEERMLGKPIEKRPVLFNR